MSGSVVYFPTKKTTTVTLTTSGNFTVPDGVTRLELELFGGGGAGGTGNGGAPYAAGGEAGNKTNYILNVTPGQVISYTIGAGGTGAPSGAGNNGGVTVFGSLQSPGGRGGWGSQLANGVSFSFPSGKPGYVPGAVGGTSTNGTVAYGGGDAGIGNGGQSNAAAPARNGGTAAGGGAGPNSGNGGNGIIYVTYTNPVS